MLTALIQYSIFNQTQKFVKISCISRTADPKYRNDSSRYERLSDKETKLKTFFYKQSTTRKVTHNICYHQEHFPGVFKTMKMIGIHGVKFPGGFEGGLLVLPGC